MITHQLAQGSPEWIAYRAKMRNASDAPAMMGASPYTTRADLLRQLHTGVAPVVDASTQKSYDNGHRAEALARPLAEEFIGAELFPVTGSEGQLSASFDGITMDDDTLFEHKALNNALRAVFAEFNAPGDIEDGTTGRALPVYHRIQMEQQLHISKASRVLFMSSKWDADGNLVEEHHCWYYPDLTLRQQILDGWAQFELDLAAYSLPETVEPVVAKPMESLPAVAVRMEGALSVQSNLPAFGAALRTFVQRIPSQPSTDQEFADTEAACKALKRAEEALDAAESNALASMADVEAMRRMVADFRTLARDTRLAKEKMVERRKQDLKEGAVVKARSALEAHIAALNGEIAPMRIPQVPADFAGAIKGKRSLDSIREALDTLLAASKITADASARLVRTNVAVFREKAGGLEFLFSDLGQLINKPADDFAMLVTARIATHQAAEAEKARKAAEAEAQRIAAAEQRAREQEAARIAAQQAESARLAAAAVAQAAAPAPAAAPAVPPIAASVPQSAPIVPPPAPMVSAPRADEPATLNLGAICARLDPDGGIALRAKFLADRLHITPARTERGIGYYTESQYRLICRQMVGHVSAMAELYAGEPA